MHGKMWLAECWKCLYLSSSIRMASEISVGVSLTAGGGGGGW